MDADRRIVLILIVAVTATVTGDPWITALVGVVAWVPLRWWRPRRRDTSRRSTRPGRHINRTSCTPGQACQVFAVACATWWGLPWRTVDDDIWLIYPPAEPWAVLADRHGWPARTVTLHIKETPS